MFPRQVSMTDMFNNQLKPLQCLKFLLIWSCLLYACMNSDHFIWIWWRQGIGDMILVFKQCINKDQDTFPKLRNYVVMYLSQLCFEIECDWLVYTKLMKTTVGPIFVSYSISSTERAKIRENAVFRIFPVAGWILMIKIK